MSSVRLAPWLRLNARAGLPALIMVALMLVWAADNGGFDAATWYWGALVALAVLALVVGVVLRGRPSLTRPSAWAIGCLAAYVAWSYLSMTWAQYPGLALDGSNRALLYLLLFTLLTVLPWTRAAALGAVLAFALGVGVMAVVLIVRLAADDGVAGLFVSGRLAAPTGYINSTAALFTIEALVSIALAARRTLPGPLRGLLITFAAAGLQLAIIVQSRGWLFTLPLVALVAIVVVPDRLRVTAAATIALLAAAIPVQRLLHVYQTTPGSGLGAAAMHAARPALMILAATFLVGTLLAWADRLYRGPQPSPAARRAVSVALVVVALAGVLGGGLVVSKGDPVGFISRQWNGFSHQQASYGNSHFTDVGSGRYDFWRVALDAFVAHPVGGLGQDNFGDYYLPRGRTGEEPSWTHSLELRLLTHTGIVGFVLFFAFLGCAIAAALRTRRHRDPAVRLLAATLMLPLIDWLVHGSLDWFWEVPALTGPALAFLGAAGGLATGLAITEPTTSADALTDPPGGRTSGPDRARWRVRPPVPVAGAVGVLAVVAATLVLTFPFLSAREVGIATAGSDPSAALAALHRAATLDPLSSDPGRIAGAIALRAGNDSLAAERFRQSIVAEPGGWFAWLGAGLAESALGHRSRARRDFAVARSIDGHQPAVIEAARRVDTPHPLTSAQAFRLLDVVQ